VQLGRIWWLGFVPAVAVTMLLVGARIGAVPFNHIPGVGWTLLFGALLLLLGCVGQLADRRWWALALLAPLALAEGAGAWWLVTGPERVGAALVGLGGDRMGELLIGYVDIYGVGPEVDPLAERLADEVPLPQVLAFHSAHPRESGRLGIPDACVARLSREGPASILEHLTAAHDTFGNPDGLLAPLAAALDMKSEELDHGALALNMGVLYDIAPPNGPFPRLAGQLCRVAASEAEAAHGDALHGDRGFGELVLAAAEAGSPTASLDSRGAPAVQGLFDDMLRRHYLVTLPGTGGPRVIHLRYRELRAGEIVQTGDGPRPVDIVSAELRIRFELAGEVIYDRSFRGDSPLDTWRSQPPDESLRGAYRQAAVDALNQQLTGHFAHLRVP
jgi:hypothetical protein